MHRRSECLSNVYKNHISNRDASAVDAMRPYIHSDMERIPASFYYCLQGSIPAAYRGLAWFLCQRGSYGLGADRGEYAAVQSAYDYRLFGRQREDRKCFDSRGYFEVN